MGGRATDNQLRPELLSSALFKAEKSKLLLIMRSSDLMRISHSFSLGFLPNMI